MNAGLLDQLKRGKKIKVKHSLYNFTIHAELKLEDGKAEPSVRFEKINLPQKATKGEKYLLRLAQIYCFDVMCQNMLDDILESKEYKKILASM